MVQNKNNKERKKEIALLLVDKLRLPMFCNWMLLYAHRHRWILSFGLL
jgi:hypothetical protein